MFALSKPFAALDENYVSGSTVDTQLYPKQFPNQVISISSAESCSSELYKDWSYCWHRMLLGDQQYFAMSIDCNFPLAPRTYGEPTPPQLSKETIANAEATNPYRCRREYYNIFDESNDEFSLLKRSAIRKASEPFLPEKYCDPEAVGYIIAYDPALKVDRSVIGVGKLFRDPKKGLMVKLVYMQDLFKQLPTGEKMVQEFPEQIEVLKELIHIYNGDNEDYDKIAKVLIDKTLSTFLATGSKKYSVNCWKP